jgi:hypothetical protein
MSYNEKIYAGAVQHFIPEIQQDDLAWLCNQAGNIYRNLNDGCIDNFRCCAGDSMSEQYRYSYDNGCCGFSDNIVQNPLTGRVFMIGFNYGH